MQRMVEKMKWTWILGEMEGIESELRTSEINFKCGQQFDLKGKWFVLYMILAEIVVNGNENENVVIKVAKFPFLCFER